MKQCALAVLALVACDAGMTMRAAPTTPKMIDGPPHPEVSVIHAQSYSGDAQYHGVADRAAIGYVQVMNGGASAADAEILCILRPQRDGREIDEVITTITARVTALAPSEKRLVDLVVPIDEVRLLETREGNGVFVACGTRPAGSTDAYTHTRTGVIYFARYEAPDLRWRSDGPWLAAYDCATRAMPVAGRDVCLDVFLGEHVGMNSTFAQHTRIGVACRIGDRTARVETSLDQQHASLALRLPPVTAGTHDARCTLDIDRAIAERAEQDNDVTARVQVLGTTTEWRYAAAIRRIGATAKWLPGGFDSPSEPAYSLDVVIANTGAHGLRDVTVECTGAGIVFRGGGVSTFPEHAIRPGEITLHITTEGALPQPGPVELVCTLRVTSPNLPIAPHSLTAIVQLPR